MGEEKEDTEISLNDESNGQIFAEDEMHAFVIEYGAYAELIYSYVDGNLMKIKEALKTPANEFMFWIEYKLKKAEIEYRASKARTDRLRNK